MAVCPPRELGQQPSLCLCPCGPGARGLGRQEPVSGRKPGPGSAGCRDSTGYRGGARPRLGRVQLRPAAGGSKAAQGLCWECWSCPRGQGLSAKQGRGIFLPYRDVLGAHLSRAAGAGFFWGWGDVARCPLEHSTRVEVWGGGLRVLLGESTKCSGIWGKRGIQSPWEDLVWCPPLWCQLHILVVVATPCGQQIHQEVQVRGTDGDWQRDGAVGQGVCAWAVPGFLLLPEGKACFGAQTKMSGAVGSFAPVCPQGWGAEQAGISLPLFPAPFSAREMVAAACKVTANGV